MKPPIPCGPNRLLWPVNAIASAFNLFISISITPADWAVSITKNILCFLAIYPIEAISWIDPVTLDAWDIIISLVFGFILFSISRGLMKPVLFAFTNVTSILELEHSFKGRSIELCSIVEEITWSPGLRRPFIKIFKDVVILLVKITLLDFSYLKKLAIFSRAVNRYLLLSNEFEEPDLFALPPILVI